MANSFQRFWQFYLGEHQNPINRRLHFIGTTLAIFNLGYALFSTQYKLMWLSPLFGYAFAWSGHFFFEKNKPATFKYPVLSLLADFWLWGQCLKAPKKWLN